MTILLPHTDFLFTSAESDLLGQLANRPLFFAEIRREQAETGSDELRASTVSGLLQGLVNCGLVIQLPDGRYALTELGGAAVALSRGSPRPKGGPTLKAHLAVPKNTELEDLPTVTTVTY